jgi:Exonuclease
MSYFMVDVETDGPIPGIDDYSMIEIGAVLVEPSLGRTFHGRLRPISERWIPEALAVTGRTREETLAFPMAADTVREFAAWVAANNAGKRAMFISDNNGFDYLFASWYLYHFIGSSPFGHSSTNLGSLYKGMIKDTFKNFKHLRKTRHTHNPVDDAMGNAEALLHMRDAMGLGILLE